jgi:hypothetical protein
MFVDAKISMVQRKRLMMLRISTPSSTFKSTFPLLTVKLKLMKESRESNCSSIMKSRVGAKYQNQ